MLLRNRNSVQCPAPGTSAEPHNIQRIFYRETEFPLTEDKPLNITIALTK
jgi:hypothetical protein